VILDIVARTIIGHLRPDLPFPYFLIIGLPSGHALDATTCYGALVVVAWPHLSRGQRILATTAASLLVVAVSYSRVVLLSHYLSDVLGGVLLGLAWLLVVVAGFGPQLTRGSGASASMP
jgi:undecaprenyl-diphosphatase